MIMRKLAASIIVLAALAGWAVAVRAGHSEKAVKDSGQIQIVAAENFWGSLVAQLGGSKVNVLSIVSDPNADPHEYESNTTDARAFAGARYVVLNGAGYDAWAQALLSANAVHPAERTVLSVATLLGKKEGDNPHFWYSPAYVNRVVAQMEQDLIQIDPNDAGYFHRQAGALLASLGGYQERIADIRQHFAGTPVAATEDIFAYLAQAAGLNLISPSAFTQAVAEGNDPTAASIAVFQQQLAARQPKILVYNEQTLTPLTQNMKQLAAGQHIPTIGVTETMQPPTMRFQDWMNGEVAALSAALTDTSAPGQ